MPPRPPRQPIFKIPPVVLALIGLMAAVQLVRDWLPDAVDAQLLFRFAFVPGRVTYAVDPGAVLATLRAFDLADPAGQQGFAVARFFLGTGALQPWTLLTYALLHGGWTHFGLNAVWLLAFGAPVARRLGSARFLVFMAMGAIAGALAQTLADPVSLQPLVGASAAVSACMGAALRFLFHRDEARGPLAEAPCASLRAVFTHRNPLTFVVAWFVTNLATGLAAIPLGLSDAPIAWQAHIGGFLLGLLLFPWFDRGPAGAAEAWRDGTTA